MPAPCCGSCRFFQVENAASRMGSLALYAGTTGECRRYPPKMVVNALLPTGLPTPEWPILPETEWCGEFTTAEQVAA